MKCAGRCAPTCSHLRLPISPDTHNLGAVPTAAPITPACRYHHAPNRSDPPAALPARGHVHRPAAAAQPSSVPRRYHATPHPRSFTCPPGTPSPTPRTWTRKSTRSKTSSWLNSPMRTSSGRPHRRPLNRLRRLQRQSPLKPCMPLIRITKPCMRRCKREPSRPLPMTSAAAAAPPAPVNATAEVEAYRAFLAFLNAAQRPEHHRHVP